MTDEAVDATSAEKRFRIECERYGFDLVQPFLVGWYDEQVEGSLRLGGPSEQSHRAYLVANTKALWPAFTAALAGDRELAELEHPLDAYTERQVARAAKSLGGGLRFRWAHDRGKRVVAMQRLAAASGLAPLGPSHLNVHPVHGPWIGLRAVVITNWTASEVKPALHPNPCGDCEAHCLPHYRRARAASSSDPVRADVESNLALWLACRDACPVGRASRYGTAQIRYHYLKDRSVLPNGSVGATP